jgi:glycolate oxidase
MGKGLEEIITDRNRILSGEIEDKYLTDSLGRIKGTASHVVFPISTAEVSEVLKYAYENNIPVTPRGAGTNLTGSTVPEKGGIILDMSKMNHILEIDTETLTATVEPGVVLEDFQQKVESLGLFYPPDPGEKKATLGGNISTNAGGMRAVKYGVTRDYVRGLEIVLANGEVTVVGSKNVKDSSGLSLKNLVVGSEGTLAVITKCILRLVPKPEKTVSVVVPYESLEEGIGSVIQIIHGNTNPTAIEFVEREVAKLGEDYLHIQFPFPEAKAYLLLTFDGSESSIQENIAKTKEIVLKNEAIGFLELAPAEAADIWKVRGALVTSIEAVSEQEPVDVVVPINKSPEFIRFVHELEKKTGMQLIGFGHAGDGNVHISVVRGNLSLEEWHRLRDENMQAIYDKAAELGGLTSGEHGLGLTKKKYFLKNTNEISIEIMQSIKNSLDEKHILNDGKSYICD